MSVFIIVFDIKGYIILNELVIGYFGVKINNKWMIVLFYDVN